MQKFASLTLALSLLATTAYAADTGVLAPGNPAGVDQAQIWNGKTLAVLGGGAAIVIGFAILTSDSSKSSTGTLISGGGGNTFGTSTTTTATTTTR